MKQLTTGAAVFLLLGAGAGQLEAQGVASSFHQLAVLVKPGDKITVVDTAGREAAGRIGQLTRDTLTLVTPAGARELVEADIEQIRQRRRDSLRNGAIIGAVAAVACYSGLMVIAQAGGFGDTGGGLIVSSVIRGGVLWAGIGAAAGAGIDALIERRQVIYRKPGGGNRVGVSPLFGGGRRGAAITVTF